MNNELTLTKRLPLSLIIVLIALSGCNQKLIPRQPDSYSKNEAALNAEVVEATRPIPTGISLNIDTTSKFIESRLSKIAIRDTYFRQQVVEKVLAFYALNKNQTKWIERYTANAQCYALMDAIRDSYDYGMRPTDYSIDNIIAELGFLYSDKSVQEAALHNLDIEITAIYFLFTSHLMEGRIRNPGYGNKVWIRKSDRLTDDVMLLVSSKDDAGLRNSLSSLQPQREQFLKLQAALKQYRSLEKTGKEVAVISFDAKEKIKPNDFHPSVPLIRKKLALTDLKTDSINTDSIYYDENLVSAVKWFQLRHGLEPDGVIGAGTMKFLNQTIAQKIKIIELNLERMRWEPETYGQRYILVNIPEYKLRVFEEKSTALEMKVIVGAESTASPVFSDTLRYLVFSPTWAVPVSIIRDEIIPKLKQNAEAYTGKDYSFYKNGSQVDPATEAWNEAAVNPYSYNVVQSPGKNNALGLVKFVMPNNMNIYLHDTPNHRLFSKTNRALSHGCIRLDDPDKLAEYLLRDSKGWEIENVIKAMYSSTPQTIHLKKNYPVHLQYHTAWVDENGLVNFRDDIYGHDKRQLSLLNASETAYTVSSN